MSICSKCISDEHVAKAGFLRGKQRYYCKECDVNFTMEITGDKINRKSHQTTIIDIAKSLGVAPSTVSSALNNKAEINPATR